MEFQLLLPIPLPLRRLGKSPFRMTQSKFTGSTMQIAFHPNFRELAGTAHLLWHAASPVGVTAQIWAAYPHAHLHITFEEELGLRALLEAA